MDIWGVINHFMTPKEFAKICSTSRASYAARQQLAVAEVRYEPSDDEQVYLRQLQLSRWPACHSLCINLGQLQDTMEFSQTQRDKIEEAGSTMPSLHCLHLIGRKEVRLTESSIEGVLVSILAKHALVVTMQVRNVIMPLNLPNLQHLVLDMEKATDYWKPDLHCALFGSINLLRGLKTLYLRSRASVINKAIDLTDCSHLRCMAVQGVALRGGLALPDGCFLHANGCCSEDCVLDGGVFEITPGIARPLTGLTLCEDTPYWQSVVQTSEWVKYGSTRVCNLTRLRIISCYPRQVSMGFGPWSMLNLEVLELDVQGDMFFHLCPGLALKRLVLITTGSMHLNKEDYLLQRRTRTPTLTELYFQSRASFSPSDMAALLAHYAKEPGAEVKLSDYVKDEQHRWTAQMPATFQPGNLRECCCGACPECLVRGGVPILCDNAWTRDGFEKHLRPHIRRNSQNIEHAFEKLSMASHNDQESRS